jgi:hypothetical protein
MDEKRKAELRGLCERATEGPWVRNAHAQSAEEYDDIGSARTGHHVAYVGSTGDNAKFIMEARTALPELLDEIEQLQEQLEQWEKWPPRGYDYLMDIFDCYFPEDICPTLPDNEKRDIGPRMISAIRLIDRKSKAFKAELDAKDREIDRLTAELAAEKKRADAAVDDLVEAGYNSVCTVCKQHHTGSELCDTCADGCFENFEWRGTVAAEGETE